MNADRAGAALLVTATTAALLGACSGDESPAPPASASASAGGPPASSSSTPASPGLESYTDPGDGCDQAISAISYADDVLRPLGQEPYQEFDDVVRSRLAAVAGTLALEAEDWPDEPVHQQAIKVQELAEAAAARSPTPSATPSRSAASAPSRSAPSRSATSAPPDPAVAARATVLLRYRIQAATLVLVCRDAEPLPRTP